MKTPRRKLPYLIASVFALAAIPPFAWAQAYPSRPVRIIVGFPPGGATDIAARLIGQRLSERLGQQFIIDNRPGASSSIGTEAVVRAAPDGYTLLYVTTANAISSTVFDKSNFNRDITPVAGIVSVPFIMLVNPSIPAKTVPEFIAYAKANPGKLNMASGGNGTPTHVTGELFKMMTGVNMVHVPYRGTPITDLLSGQIQVYFSPLPASIEYVRAGKLRGLAVTTAMRSEVLPDMPTIGEFVPGFEASAWFGMGAPKRTAAEIIDKLNREINLGLADSKIKTRLADLGATVLPGSPADFAKFIVEETEKWAKVVKFAGIRTPNDEAR